MVATKRKKSDERGGLLERQDQGMDALDTDADDLAANVPDSLTIDVSLPATVHDTPEDELAVAIVEVPVNPGEVVGGGAPANWKTASTRMRATARSPRFRPRSRSTAVANGCGARSRRPRSQQRC